MRQKRITVKRVELGFLSQFKDVMLSGQKVATSRTRRRGHPGDVFVKFGHVFEIVGVCTLPLGFVADYLYKQEGTDSPDEFKKIWRNIHQAKGYISTEMVYTHFFEGVGEAEHYVFEDVETLEKIR